MAETAPVSEFPLETIRAAHRQTFIIVASIAATLPIYAIVVEIIRRSEPGAAPVTTAAMLRIVFFILAGVCIFTATMLKGLLLRTVPATAEARLARLRVSSIVTAALAEGPAVLGFALFILTRSRADFYILLVVAAYLLVRHLPQQAAWELYVRRGGDAR